MDELLAKKLGEVWAFSRIGKECKERAGNTYTDIFGEDGLNETLDSFTKIIEVRANDAVKDKADKTTQKLRDMMEHYIGDEWHKPTEVMEWLSFYTGAAGAHWSLVEGFAQQLGDNELLQTAQDAVAFFYTKYLQAINEKLESYGENKKITE